MINEYIKGKRHPAYQETVRIANHLSFHINDWQNKITKEDDYSKLLNQFEFKKENPFFDELIGQRRPGESPYIQMYRKMIYVNINKQTTNKTITSLKKIVRSEDWKIDFSNVKTSNLIPEGEDLENYIKTKYPSFGSLENWLYTTGLKEVLTDPNSLIVVAPTSFCIQCTQFFEPFTYLIKSEDVLDFIPDELAVVRTNFIQAYKTERGEIIKNRIIWILTRNDIFEATQVDDKGNWAAELLLEHNLDLLPAWRPQGVFKKALDNQIIYDSYLSPMLPRLDEAAREYSDLQAEWVQHVHSQMWYYEGQDCVKCNGTGKVIKAGEQIVCPSCEGRGRMKKQPFEDIVVRQPTLDDQSLTPPFAGYIEKNTEVPKLMNDHIAEHHAAALSSINMEFLAFTPLNQSGKAKEVDRSELNNYVYSVAHFIVSSIVKPSIFLINELRYAEILNERKDQLPQITTPERFDILGDTIIADQLEKARQAKFDATIIDALEVDYAAKVFRTNPDLAKKVAVIKKHDPFTGKESQSIADGVLSGTIKKEDAILHEYINYFVDQSIEEHEGFLDLPFKQQSGILRRKANEKAAQGA